MLRPVGTFARMWNDPDDPVDNLTGPERRRFWTVWALFAAGVAIPLWLLLPRLSDDSSWEPWLDGRRGWTRKRTRAGHRGEGSGAAAARLGHCRRHHAPELLHGSELPVQQVLGHDALHSGGRQLAEALDVLFERPGQRAVAL